MSNPKEIKVEANIYDVVKNILTNYPATRDSDKQLILQVYRNLGLTKHVSGGIMRMQVEVVPVDSFIKGPSFESVTRARRKVQEKNPSLRAHLDVKVARTVKEETKGTFIYRERP